MTHEDMESLLREGAALADRLDAFAERAREAAAALRGMRPGFGRKSQRDLFDALARLNYPPNTFPPAWEVEVGRFRRHCR